MSAPGSGLRTLRDLRGDQKSPGFPLGPCGTHPRFPDNDALSPRRYFAISLRRCHLQFDLRISLISFPKARAARTEDQDEGVRSFDPRQTLDFPTQNPFLKLNLAAIFGLQPLALSLSLSSRSACSAYPYKKFIIEWPSSKTLHFAQNLLW